MTVNTNTVLTPDEFIEDRFYSTLVNKIKSEVKLALNERNDEHNDKGMRVNGRLKIKCSKYGLGFMNNCNISFKKHLNRSGLHLNYIGTIALANNFLKAINV